MAANSQNNDFVINVGVDIDGAMKQLGDAVAQAQHLVRMAHEANKALSDPAISKNLKGFSGGSPVGSVGKIDITGISEIALNTKHMHEILVDIKNLLHMDRVNVAGGARSVPAPSTNAREFRDRALAMGLTQSSFGSRGSDGAFADIYKKAEGQLLQNIRKAPGAQGSQRDSNYGASSFLVYKPQARQQEQLLNSWMKARDNYFNAVGKDFMEAEKDFKKRQAMIVGSQMRERQWKARDDDKLIGQWGRSQSAHMSNLHSEALKENRLFDKERRRPAADTVALAVSRSQENKMMAAELERAHGEAMAINKRMDREKLAQTKQAEKDRRQAVNKANMDGREGVFENTFKRVALFGGISLGLYKAIEAGQRFISTMIQMDKQIADLRKTLAGTDEDFERLVNSAINIARRYKASTQDVLDAMELFSRQFKNSADLEALSKSAILFSNISGLSLKDSAETLTATLQQYNMTVSDAEKITDSWAAVAANSAVTTKDLGDAVAVAGGAAKQAGLSFDEFNGMISTVAAATGKSGKEIGNAFTRIFERSTSDEGVKKLGRLGIHVKDASGQFRDFQDVLGDVSGNWDKWTESQKKNVAVAFAGARQYSVFLALMNNYQKSTMMTAISQDSLGAALAQNDRIAETFVKKIQRLSVEYDNLARSAGNKALPVMGMLVDTMTKLLQLFNESGAAVKYLGGALAALTVGNLVSSFAFKAFGTEMIDGKRSIRSTSLLAGTQLGANSINEKGGVSLLRGLMTGATNIAQGVGSGVLGAKVGGAGILGAKIGASSLGGAVGMGATATLMTGILALTTVFGTLAFTVYKVIQAYDYFRSKIPDLLRSDSENTQIAAQKVSELLQTSDKLGSGFKRSDSGKIIGFDQGLAQGVIQDVLRKNPEIIKSQNIHFDRLGNAIGINIDRLLSLQSALNYAAESAQNFSFATSAANSSQKASEFWNSAQGGKFIKSIGGSNDNNSPFQGVDSILSRNGVNAGSALRAINAKLIDKRFDFAGEFGQKEFDNNKEMFSSFGVRNLDEADKVVKLLKEARDIRMTNQDAFNPAFIKILTSPKLNGETDEQADKRRMSTAVSFRDRQNAALNVGAPETYRPLINLVVPDLGKRTPGPDGVDFDDGLGKRLRNFRPRQVGRIDLELQKSLIDSETNSKNLFNFGNLGSEVDVAAEALVAYRKAIIELGTETKKAAGPQEEAAFLDRQERIDKMKKDIADWKSEGKEADPAKRKELEDDIVATEQILYIENNIQEAVQKENDERLRGLEILKKQYMILDAIVMNSRILQGAMASTLSSIPGDMRENILGNRQSLADRDFAQARLDRVLSGGQETADKRNQAKHIREEIDGINRSMDQLNEKTSIWGNLLQKIGDAYISDIAQRLSKSFANTLSGEAVSELSKKLKTEGVYGEANTKFDVTGGIVLGGAGVGVGALAATDNKNKKMTDEEAEALKWKYAGAAQVGGGGVASQMRNGGSPGGIDPETMKAMGVAVQGALLGAGAGSAMTSAQGKTGHGGAIGGAIGGVVGSTVGAAYGGAIWGPLVGGLIGSFFDKDIEPLKKTLDELSDSNNNISYQLQSLSKSLNTINDTMENIINAPSNFVLPIPKGILENSVTAQSAIATPLQAGGLIIKSGPAFLHAGERVLREGSSSGGGTVVHNSFTINGGNQDPEMIADAVMSKMGSKLFYQSVR